MYRFAPSPTGDMHIGNLRAAIFNFLCSKRRKKGFFIRIEDTDKERNIEGKDKDILELLAKFGITYDAIYYQSKNLKYHRQCAMQLMEKNMAFSCFCTHEELEKKRELAKDNSVAYRYDNTCAKLSDDEVLNNTLPFVVRIKQPTNAISFDDDIKGKLVFEPENIDSFVILRQDKTPTYNFACAIDDMLQGTTHIIRGEDHVSNTPKQEHIRKSLGFNQTMHYTHLPIILNNDGKKMSKRDDASSVQWLLDQGFLHEAITNYLILLGNKTPKEIFTLNEAMQWFELDTLSKAPARFDIDQLRHINREHLKMKDSLELASLIGYNDSYVGDLIKLYTQEGSTLAEISPKIELLLNKKIAPDGFENQFNSIKECIQALNEDFETYDLFKNYIIENTKLKGKDLFKPLRILLTGTEHGPELPSLYTIIKPYIKEITK